VQAVIETTLGQILKEQVSIMGCGRTDAQVHASQFFFHLDVKNSWDFDLLFRLNKLLPDDIAIFEIIPVEDNQHARFDAVMRTYEYFIHTLKDPFLSTTSSLYLEKNLHLEKMKAAASLLVNYKDYGALCKTPSRYRHTTCDIKSASLFSDAKGEKFRFQISADRFLNRMIRIIVGKLIEIGRGELTLEEFEGYLITRQTPKTIEPAYPQGLYLSKVTYPFLDIPPRTEFLSMLNNIDTWEPV
jgi:tRNA pseudouridine38-40 synthase